MRDSLHSLADLLRDATREIEIHAGISNDTLLMLKNSVEVEQIKNNKDEGFYWAKFIKDESAKPEIIKVEGDEVFCSGDNTDYDLSEYLILSGKLKLNEGIE